MLAKPSRSWHTMSRCVLAWHGKASSAGCCNSDHNKEMLMDNCYWNIE
jgi:hypothetical protein